MLYSNRDPHFVSLVNDRDTDADKIMKNVRKQKKVLQTIYTTLHSPRTFVDTK